MNIRFFLAIVLAIAMPLGGTSCNSLGFMDEFFYKGSTPGRRKNMRNSIFDREEYHAKKASTINQIAAEQTGDEETPDALDAVPEGIAVEEDTPVAVEPEPEARPRSRPGSPPARDGIWYTNMEMAVEEAQSSNRPLFLSFSGSDWCTYCKELDRHIYNSGDFQLFARNEVIPVKIDFPKGSPSPPALAAQNENLKKRYQIVSLPTIILLKADGTYIGRTGYKKISAVEFVRSFRDIIAVSN